MKDSSLDQKKDEHPPNEVRGLSARRRPGAPAWRHTAPGMQSAELLICESFPLLRKARRLLD
ncbi:hypothetical protein EYF80_067146 [Liparis tanakae]|uniref:Uncharacterized protein n=1 Tax=Liparis tanakae TaxID=230148 RepID=A0A4Z2E1U5_9TELE|nr:hypothetical protein EYF80_067146 [Liparis tanakae]